MLYKLPQHHYEMYSVFGKRLSLLMEVHKSTVLQQTNNSSMCESTQRSCEPRRKRTDERSAPSEMARIITDPTTGKCYCRGKVLGKVALSSESHLDSLEFTSLPGGTAF